MKLSRGLIEASFKDSSGGGTSIISKKAGEIARSMGLAPSEAEVTHFVKSVGPQCDLNSFVRFCDSISHPEDTYENLVQFFLLYDIKNTKTITKKLFTSLFANTGECLQEKDIEDLLVDFASPDGNFDYDKFLKE